MEGGIERLNRICFIDKSAISVLGALVDSCGECTGGTTGLSRDNGIDCRGQCRRNIFDSTLNMCLP